MIDDILNYKEFLQEDTQIKFIKEKTRTGKPCGDEEFYDKVQLLTGVDYKKKAGIKGEKQLGILSTELITNICFMYYICGTIYKKGDSNEN